MCVCPVGARILEATESLKQRAARSVLVAESLDNSYGVEDLLLIGTVCRCRVR